MAADKNECQKLFDAIVKLADDKNASENENLETESHKNDSKFKQNNSWSGNTSTQTDFIFMTNKDDSKENQDGNMQVKRQSDNVPTSDATAEDKVNSCNDKNNENASCGSLEGKKGKKRLCDPCLFDDVNEIANSFCVVCVEYLCKSCARDHRRSKATRNHKVMIDEDIPDDPKHFKLMKSLVSCTDHPEMDISYKCKAHEKFICTRCLVVSHRKCEEVIEIANMTTRDKVSTMNDVYSLLPNTLQSVYEKTVSVRNAKEENIKQLQNKNSCVQMERSEYIKCLQEQLQKLNEKCNIEIEAIVTTTLHDLEKDINTCKKIEEKEIAGKCLLDVTLRYGNTAEINIICEKVEKDIKEFKDETIKQEAKPVVNLKFDRNKSFEEIVSIGSVRIIKGQNEGYQENISSRKNAVELSSDDLREKTNNVGKNVVRKSFMQSSVSKRRIMYDVQSATSHSTEKCSITSMLLLPDKRVVLTDYSNKQIKVLNKNLSIQIESKLDGKPIDMCHVSRSSLAVIIDGVKCIKKYTIDGENISSPRNFPCKLYPISIGNLSSAEDKVVILFSDEEKMTPKKSDYDNIEIQIRSMSDAKVLQTFTDFRNKSSLKMVLENPGRIRHMISTPNAFLVSENMKLRCVETDKDNSSVLKEKWYFKSYKENKITDITDIALDKEGNIYVCGKSSKNIHQISGSNYKQNRLLLTVTGNPLSLCVDDDSRQLIVGCEKDDFIYVIKLK